MYSFHPLSIYCSLGSSYQSDICLLLVIVRKIEETRNSRFVNRCFNLNESLKAFHAPGIGLKESILWKFDKVPNA